MSADTRGIVSELGRLQPQPPGAFPIPPYRCLVAGNPQPTLITLELRESRWWIFPGNSFHNPQIIAIVNCVPFSPPLSVTLQLCLRHIGYLQCHYYYYYYYYYYYDYYRYYYCYYYNYTCTHLKKKKKKNFLIWVHTQTISCGRIALDNIISHMGCQGSALVDCSTHFHHGCGLYHVASTRGRGTGHIYRGGANAPGSSTYLPNSTPHHIV